MKFNVTREITVVSLNPSEKFNLGYLRINLLQTWYDDRYYRTLHLDTSLIDLDRDSRSQECKKAKSSAAIISQNFRTILDGIWYTVVTRWLMKLMFILSYY